MHTVNDVVMTIIKLFPRDLGRTELMKLVYLSDCEYYRLKEETLTGLGYTRDNHGPVNYEILDSVNDLSSQGFVFIGEEITPYGNRRVSHQATDKAASYLSDLTPDQHEVLSSIVSVCGRMNSQEILNLAYATSPMLRILEVEKVKGHLSMKGEVVPMDALHPKPRFTAAEIRKVMQQKDFTIRPMSPEGAEELIRLHKEFEPLRERAERVATPETAN